MLTLLELLWLETDDEQNGGHFHPGVPSFEEMMDALPVLIAITEFVVPRVAGAERFAYADTEAMQKHLDEISRRVARGAHAALLLDRAGWHTTDKLNIPKNVTMIFLPSRSPELNPVENVWQYLRANWLSNSVFETYDDIIDAACDAWNKLTAAPDLIKSIGMRQWAHIGHS